MRRILFLLTFGLGGLAVLLSLGTWQMQRLDWKQELLAEMESRIAAPAIPLPATATEADDEYIAVTLTGTPTGQELHVLSSGSAAGTGYRVISAWVTNDDRRVMVDMGVMPLDAKAIAPTLTEQTITGNLFWPDDAAATSPAPDLNANIWFARDTAAMAEALDTEPLMVALRTTTAPDPRVTIVPVNTSGIKNDHREYAITWFLLAFVWAAMTGYFLYRSSKDSKKD